MIVYIIFDCIFAHVYNLSNSKHKVIGKYTYKQ